MEHFSSSPRFPKRHTERNSVETTIPPAIPNEHHSVKSISVIIPAYQAGHYLEAAVGSCLSQSRLPVEVIVVDDGSSDGTWEVVQKFGNRVLGKRLENGGVSRARNVGAAMASGELLLFLDADDILLPNAMESLTSCLEASAAGMAYGMVIERTGPPSPSRLNGFDFAAGQPPIPAQRNFWRSAVITPGSAIVRKNLHDRVGGFVSGYEPLEDRDYWIKCGLLSPSAFCDALVLDKTWMPSSHGSQHAKRIFRGQRAQRDLRVWCQQQNLDCSWMPADSEILQRALDEALWRRAFSILKPLCEVARSLGLRHWKSEILARVLPMTEPDWINVELDHSAICDSRIPG